MIPSIPRIHHNPLTNLIPIKPSSSSTSCFILIVSLFILISSSSSCPNNNNNSSSNSNLITMKVHPIPKKRTLIDDNTNPIHQTKKLRRLPHTFNRVLELPLESDANVTIEDCFDSLRFVVAVPEDLSGDDVTAHAVEIHPGVVKIVVRKSDFCSELLPLEELRLDRWRYRLPATIRADEATAVCVGGELVVTVPKNADDGDADRGGDGDDDHWGVNGSGRLVLVQ